MKRTVTLLALAFLIVSMLPVQSSATGIPTEYDEIIYLDNGDYITVEIGQVLNRGTTVNNNKTYTYRDSNGDEQWRAILYGTFVSAAILSEKLLPICWSYDPLAKVHVRSALWSITRI